MAAHEAHEAFTRVMVSIAMSAPTRGGAVAPPCRGVDDSLGRSSSGQYVHCIIFLLAVFLGLLLVFFFFLGLAHDRSHGRSGRLCFRRRRSLRRLHLRRKTLHGSDHLVAVAIHSEKSWRSSSVRPSHDEWTAVQEFPLASAMSWAISGLAFRPAWRIRSTGRRFHRRRRRGSSGQSRHSKTERERVAVVAGVMLLLLLVDDDDDDDVGSSMACCCRFLLQEQELLLLRASHRFVVLAG